MKRRSLFCWQKERKEKTVKARVKGERTKIVRGCREEGDDQNRGKPPEKEREDGYGLLQRGRTPSQTTSIRSKWKHSKAIQKHKNSRIVLKLQGDPGHIPVVDEDNETFSTSLRISKSQQSLDSRWRHQRKEPVSLKTTTVPCLMPTPHLLLLCQ